MTTAPQTILSRLPSRSVKNPGLTHQVITGSHTGAAGARNRALAHAHGDIVLFLGADISLRPQALAEHLRFHEAHPAVHAGALGFVLWDPRLRPTPLMEWMTHGGFK